MKKIWRILQSIETSEINLGLWMIAFLCLISTRLLVESWLFGFQSRSGAFLFYEWTHNFFFFLFSFLLFLPIFQFFSRVSLSIASNMLLFGFLIILSPPIIDFLMSNGKGLWSFYIFDGFFGLISRYLTFFGDRPDMGITYGVRVEVALVTVFFGMYVFLKTRGIFRSFFASISAYTLLFVLGTFPSWVSMVIEGISNNRWVLRGSDVAGIFLSPFAFFSRNLIDPHSILNAKMSLMYATFLPFVLGLWLFLKHRRIFLAIFRNVRFPQAVFHAGLLFFGMGLALIFSLAKFSFELFDILAIFSLLVATISAWLASVVVNDFFDSKIDIVTNPTRPLPSGTISHSTYVAIGVGFFLASILFSALVSVKGALLLFLYQVLAWGYSAPPFRLKRFSFIASFTSAVASVLVLILGFTSISSDGTIETLPISFIFLFLFAYTTSIPLKDFKDIPGDRKDGVWTLPVLFGAERAKIFIGSGIFFSYIASVFVFHSPILFLPAIVFGSASFWVVLLMREKTGRITYRSVFWWILWLVLGYGFLGVGVLF